MWVGFTPLIAPLPFRFRGLFENRTTTASRDAAPPPARGVNGARRFASGRTLEFEVCQHMMPAAPGASFLADDSVQAAPVPTLPTQDVLSKAVSVTFSLMKPTSTFT